MMKLGIIKTKAIRIRGKVVVMIGEDDEGNARGTYLDASHNIPRVLNMEAFRIIPTTIMKSTIGIILTLIIHISEITHLSC